MRKVVGIIGGMVLFLVLVEIAVGWPSQEPSSQKDALSRNEVIAGGPSRANSMKTAASSVESEKKAGMSLLTNDERPASAGSCGPDPAGRRRPLIHDLKQ